MQRNMFTIDKLKYSLKSEKEELLYFIGLIQENVGQILHKASLLKEIQLESERDSLELTSKLRLEIEELLSLATEDNFHLNLHMKRLGECSKLIQSCIDESKILKHWILLNHWKNTANLEKVKPTEILDPSSDAIKGPPT